MDLCCAIDDDLYVLSDIARQVADMLEERP